MANLTNSHSLTEFQRNAHHFIEGLNESKEPLLLTVNGKVQAVLVDPVTFQKMEEEVERQGFIAAIQEGERAIQEGRTRPAEELYAEIKARYGF
jgi:PHD/YefM family antitoxin component YafN of YafNO toxin-antitoxin module